jgi:hypothetical protein
MSIGKALFAQVRTQNLTLTSIELRGPVALTRTLETAETLDGLNISFEGIMLVAAVGNLVCRIDFFAPESEPEARLLFDSLAPPQIV